MLFLGANHFLLEQTPFQKGIAVQENKQEVAKVVPLVKNGSTSTKALTSTLTPTTQGFTFSHNAVLKYAFLSYMVNLLKFQTLNGLTKWHMQTVSIQIRLQSDQGLHGLPIQQVF